MTPEEQRIAIIEAIGWVRIDPFTVGRTKCDWPVWAMGLQRISFKSNTVPDYLNDLNNMQEAVMTLSDEKCFKAPFYETQQGTYNVTLEGIVFRDARTDKCMFALINATASQRAEAFLRTIGKWKD